MTQTKPTIKAAKAYCRARYHGLPRCGYQMTIISYREWLPLAWEPTHRMPFEFTVYLVNRSGRFVAEVYSHPL